MSTNEAHRPLTRILLVTGKGGVGKTTVAAGLAFALAKAHGAAALVEFGDGESGARSLGANAHKHGVTHVVIRPDESIVRATAPLFGGGLIARMALGNFAIKRLFKAAPAVRELAMLECVRLVAEEKKDRPIVVDLPATGHGVAWLRVPAQLRDATVKGPLFELTDRLVRELITPGRASPIIVTLPERLVLAETLELCGAMEREVGLAPARLVVNRMPPPIPAGAIADARKLGEGRLPIAGAARELENVLSTRELARDEALAVLGDAGLRSGLRPALLPEAPTDPHGRDVAEWLVREGVLA